jgi:DNA polymerase-3 subunit delta
MYLSSESNRRKEPTKAYTIAENLNNPKENPMVVTTSLVLVFIQLLKYHGLKDRNPKNVAAVIGVNPYFLKEYDVALKIIP